MADPPLVLFVEDDESLRQILARHLRANGFRVEEAASAEDAISALAAGTRPNVVLLDINLPGDNGWDLLRRPDLAASGSPPVVVASAITIRPRQLAEFHVAGYLPKPFPPETLIDTLGRVLSAEVLEEHA